MRVQGWSRSIDLHMHARPGPLCAVPPARLRVSPRQHLHPFPRARLPRVGQPASARVRHRDHRCPSVKAASDGGGKARTSLRQQQSGCGSRRSRGCEGCGRSEQRQSRRDCGRVHLSHLQMLSAFAAVVLLADVELGISRARTGISAERGFDERLALR